MKKEEAQAAQQGLLFGLGLAVKAAPHPLLKGAAILGAIGLHMLIGLRVQPEKEVRGTATVKRKAKDPEEEDGPDEEEVVL